MKDDRYLLSLLRYVHQNPVAAKICGRVCDYHWSSDQYYRKNNELSLVNINFVLGIFCEDHSKAIPTYCEFMDADKLEIPVDFESLPKNETDQKTAEANLLIKSVNDREHNKSQLSLERLLMDVASDEQMYQAIKSGSRKRALSVFKKNFINLAPCDLKKSGSHFDLAIAIGILIETGQLVRVKKERFGIIGELSLNSRLRACSGILPMVIAARNAGVKNVIVPQDNIQEASLVTGIQVFGFDALKGRGRFFRRQKSLSEQ